MEGDCEGSLGIVPVGFLGPRTPEPGPDPPRSPRSPSFLMNCCRCERSESRGGSAEGEEATIEPINHSNENGGSRPDAPHNVCLFLISRRRRRGAASREP